MKMGLVRCDNCELLTDIFPCEQCGWLPEVCKEDISENDLQEMFKVKK